VNVHLWAVISNKKLARGSGSTVDYNDAELLSATDYYPFGMQMPGRVFNSGGYRYGFNGKENDNEVKGEGNQIDFGMRVYDPRVAKFLSVDPMSSERVAWTPYNSMRNNPINNIDPTGALDEWVQTGGEMKWDDRVVDQKSAERIYGKGAIYRAPGYEYTAKNGDRIHLGDERMFAVNGVVKQAPNSIPANNFTPGGFNQFWQNNRGSFDSRVEAYRAWRGEPGEHEGESKWDRIFRLSANFSMEGRREFASGGMNMYNGWARGVRNTNTIYRVVTNEEAADVVANGFRQPPLVSKISAYEGKLFWTNMDDANWYLNWVGKEGNTVLKVKVDGSFIFENGTDVGRQFYFVSPERLQQLNKAIINVK